MTDRRIEIYTREGKVVWADSITGTYSLDPGEAVAMANCMLHCAEDCGVNVNVEVSAPPRVTPMMYTTLIARVGHIRRSMASFKDRSKVDRAIVDALLSEIL